MTVHKSASFDELLWSVSASASVRACCQHLTVRAYTFVLIMHAPRITVLLPISRLRDLQLCSEQKMQHRLFVMNRQQQPCICVQILLYELIQTCWCIFLGDYHIAGTCELQLWDRNLQLVGKQPGI